MVILREIWWKKCCTSLGWYFILRLLTTGFFTSRVVRRISQASTVLQCLGWCQWPMEKPPQLSANDAILTNLDVPGAWNTGHQPHWSDHHWIHPLVFQSAFEVLVDELELCWGPAMWQLWKTAGAPSAGRVELTLAELGGVTLGRWNGLVFFSGRSNML